MDVLSFEKKTFASLGIPRYYETEHITLVREHAKQIVSRRFFIRHSFQIFIFFFYYVITLKEPDMIYKPCERLSFRNAFSETVTGVLPALKIAQMSY